MPTSRSLRELVSAGVVFTPEEAVAVVLSLIHAPDDDRPPDAPGPPSLDTVHVSADGGVLCRGFQATPAVSECAILLDAMLPRSSKAPGWIRYLIARALLEVEAPPFDTIADLSAALARHERRPRETVLRELVQRVAAPVAAGPAIAERRQTAPSTAELRRQLREADAALFARAMTLPPPAVAEPVVAVPATAEQMVALPVAALPRSHAAAWALAGALAAIAAFGAGYLLANRLRHPPAARTATQTVHPAAGVHAGPPRRIPEPPDAVATTGSSPIRDAAPPRTAAITRVVPGAAGAAFSPSFSTDGTEVFFHAGRSGDSHSALETASLAGGDLRLMTIVDDGAKNYHVQPSPDGSRVAFDSDRDGERGVYVADRDGTGVQRVSGAGYAALPTWSPDGTSLAFVRAEPAHPKVWNLWLLRLASGESRQLTAFSYGQTWSASWFPDGRRIAYAHEDRLYVRDLGGDGQREYASPVANRLVRTPAVSPDGRYVIFQVARAGGWLLDLRDGSMRCVLSDPTAEEFAWSPDGRRVAFHSRRDGEWGIWAASGIQ